MQTRNLKIIAFTIVVQIGLTVATGEARGQAGKAAYPAMAPVDEYLMADESAEIALARSAAPASISDGAEVMVLGRQGYTTAVKGRMAFCVSWSDHGARQPMSRSSGIPKFALPFASMRPRPERLRRIYLMKTRLVLEGKSKAEIVEETRSALDKKELPALEPGAMCYMMSKQQYLNDRGMSWHPHLMFFVAGDAAKSWGADLPGSPVIAANDPEERVTIFMVWAAEWSDGTPGPSMVH